MLFNNLERIRPRSAMTAVAARRCSHLAVDRSRRREKLIPLPCQMRISVRRHLRDFPQSWHFPVFAERIKAAHDEFWHAARLELGAKETMEEKIDELGPPIVEPPVIAVRHGAPVGRPGERIVEQGVIDDGIEDLLIPSHSRRVDD